LPATACDDLFDARLARQNGPRERVQKGRVGHRGKRRSAPTNLTLREPVCVLAQGRSRDEISVLHDPPGQPRRGQTEPRDPIGPGLKRSAADDDSSRAVARYSLAVQLGQANHSYEVRDRTVQDSIATFIARRGDKKIAIGYSYERPRSN